MTLLVIFMHCRCVLDPGDKIVDCPPTFTMYEFDAAVNGALVIKGKDPFVYFDLHSNVWDCNFQLL